MYNQKIQNAWNERCRLCAEGNKLYAEGSKLCAEGDKLRAECDKLHAECRKLYAEGYKLQAEGDKLYAEGNIQFYDVVISIFGKEYEIKWNGANAIVDGWEYKEGYIPESCNGKVVEIDGKKYELKEIVEFVKGGITNIIFWAD